MQPSDISTYVINLETRRDRRLQMKMQLREIGWQANFTSAYRPLSADGFPSIGARGCFLSHLATLRTGLETGRHVLIMEDDLDFSQGFEMRWQRAWESLQQRDWSIFYLGHNLKDLPPGLNELSSNTSVVGAHFLLFNKACVPWVIEGLENILSRRPGDPRGGPMHVDGAYSTIREQNPRLKSYAVLPTLGKQRSSRSDISDLKFYDRIAILRAITSGFRRLKRHRSLSTNP